MWCVFISSHWDLFKITPTRGQRNHMLENKKSSSENVDVLSIREIKKESQQYDSFRKCCWICCIYLRMLNRKDTELCLHSTPLLFWKNLECNKVDPKQRQTKLKIFTIFFCQKCLSLTKLPELGLYKDPHTHKTSALPADHIRYQPYLYSFIIDDWTCCQVFQMTIF